MVQELPPVVCSENKRAERRKEGVRLSASEDEVDGPRTPTFMLDSGQSGRLEEYASPLYKESYVALHTHSIGGFGGIGPALASDGRKDRAELDPYLPSFSQLTFEKRLEIISE